MWIGRVYVNRAIQMRTMGVLIAYADLPGAGDLALDGQVGLLRIAKLEVLCDREHEGKNRQWETGRQIILIREQGIRSERIEALLIRQIAHVGQRVQHSLKNRRTVEVGRRVCSAADAGARDKPAGRRTAARTNQLHRS